MKNWSKQLMNKKFNEIINELKIMIKKLVNENF